MYRLDSFRLSGLINDMRINVSALPCYNVTTYDYDKISETADFEMKFVDDAYLVDVTDALKNSRNTSITINSTFMRPENEYLSVIKIDLPGETPHDVMEYCVKVSGARDVRLKMWQKDPDANKKSTLIAERPVTQV